MFSVCEKMPADYYAFNCSQLPCIMRPNVIEAINEGECVETTQNNYLCVHKGSPLYYCNFNNSIGTNYQNNFVDLCFHIGLHKVVALTKKCKHKVRANNDRITFLKSR